MGKNIVSAHCDFWCGKKMGAKMILRKEKHLSGFKNEDTHLVETVEGMLQGVPPI